MRRCCGHTHMSAADARKDTKEDVTELWGCSSIQHTEEQSVGGLVDGGNSTRCELGCIRNGAYFHDVPCVSVQTL